MSSSNYRPETKTYVPISDRWYRPRLWYLVVVVVLMLVIKIMGIVPLGVLHVLQ